MNVRAAHEYQTRRTQLEAQMLALAAAVKATCERDMDKVHYGDCGDLASLQHEVANMLDRINGTGEYAL
jgi:hypothetical protein